MYLALWRVRILHMENHLELVDSKGLGSRAQWERQQARRMKNRLIYNLVSPSEVNSPFSFSISLIQSWQILCFQKFVCFVQVIQLVGLTIIIDNNKIIRGTHNPFYFCRITSNVPMLISAFSKFSFHFSPLVHLATGLSILLIHSTTFLNFICCFSILRFISALIFVISFFLLTLRLACSSFTGS